MEEVIIVDSILTSVKKIIGISEDDSSFDSDIIMAINTVLMAVTQMGIGPATGYSIEDDSSTWDDFLDGNKNLEAVKTYVCLKVRLIFDPPQSSTMIEAIRQNIAECEWRISYDK